MTDAQPAQRLSNPWVVLFTLLVVSIFNFADRYLITGLIGDIKAEFNVDDGYMGLLIGPAFVVLYVVAGVPIARLADKSSRVKIIAAGCVMWSACTLATGFATGPVTLALARVGVGIGEAAFAAPAYSLLADYFRPERRGMAYAILGLATYFGQIAGQAGGPALGAAFGWHAAFWIMGAPGILLGLLVVMLIREPQRATSGPSAVVQIPFMTIVQRLKATPAYLLMMGSMGMGTLSGVAFGFWGPELFSRVYAMDPVQAKSAFAISFGLSGMAGMLCFGFLADRLSQRDKVWPLRLSGIALACATTMILFATWSDSFRIALLFAVPAGLLGGGWSVGFMAMLQYLLPVQFRASATALFLAVTTLLGFFLGPWLAGEISSQLGNGGDALRIGLSCIMPVGFLGGWLALLASRRIERDRLALADE
ncbi:spinster family MFS transporter [Sphingomonas lacunae]|uniref:spinster family MFS transporter n=1 Tax=Sphingomonas lacunae TaxID=2698828 RepID=UPI001FEBF577|nr:MFS transporter [Sphingomonas lacunae]